MPEKRPYTNEGFPARTDGARKPCRTVRLLKWWGTLPLLFDNALSLGRCREMKSRAPARGPQRGGLAGRGCALQRRPGPGRGRRGRTRAGLGVGAAVGGRAGHAAAGQGPGAAQGGGRAGRRGAAALSPLSPPRTLLGRAAGRGGHRGPAEARLRRAVPAARGGRTPAFARVAASAGRRPGHVSAAAGPRARSGAEAGRTR